MKDKVHPLSLNEYGDFECLWLMGEKYLEKN